MGIRISNHTGVITVGPLDIDFTDGISVTDDGDGTVTLNVPTDSNPTDYGDIRNRL